MSKHDPRLPKVLIPMIRRTFPELITSKIVGVQPMSGPVGLAFALRHQYNTGGEGVLLVSYKDYKDNEIIYHNKAFFKSVVGIEYKPEKVKVVREYGKKLKRPKYTTKERFTKKYFTEGL